jgi:hypothetical protein
MRRPPAGIVDLWLDRPRPALLEEVLGRSEWSLAPLALPRGYVGAVAQPRAGGVAVNAAN